MRIVDFQTFPDSNELRGRLLEAFDEVDAQGAQRADPTDPSTPLGVGFPADLDDATVRERAEAVRAALSAVIGDEARVRFQLADGQSETAGGAPDHLE